MAPAPDTVVDALRSGGEFVQLRTASVDDLEPLHVLLDSVSDHSIYLRFFALSRVQAHRFVEKVIRDDAARSRTVLALVGGQVVGICEYEPVGDARAEVALIVDDRYQREGIGTLLLEHAAVAALREGISELSAEVLSANHLVIKVLRDLGYAVETTTSGPDSRLVCHLRARDQLDSAVVARDRVATARSMRAILAPRSVAVIGASETPRSVGRAVLHALIAGRFRGHIYPVNPKHQHVLGRVCYHSIAELPAAPDLAVVAVPADAAVATVRACAERGIRGVVLLSSGFSETGGLGALRQAELVRVARDHDIRVLGPNCLGVVNTDPAVRLAATLASVPVARGHVALASQSGALGIAAAAEVSRHGVGLSQFVSMGNKADVSGNDLLQWWAEDENTHVIALYLESFGNPQRFQRIARELSRTKPIVALKAGRSAAGQRAGMSHTAATITSDDLVDALCEQSGVARVDTLAELLDAARLLASSPLPAGPRLAVVGNSGGPEILAADAAVHAGLEVPALSPAVVDALLAVAPRAAGTANPVDLGAGMGPPELAAAVRVLLACDDVDAVTVVVCEASAISTGEALTVLRSLDTHGKPLAVTLLGGRSDREVDAGLALFRYPEAAVSALATAWQCVRRRSYASPPMPQGVDPGAADAIIRRAGPGWLSAQDAALLLAAYGIGTVDQRVVRTAAAACLAATELGYPIVLKASGILHKSDVGGVRLGLRSAAEVLSAFDDLSALGSPMLVQASAPATVELLIGAVRTNYGSAVVLGAGGTMTELISDRVLRLAPLNTSDVDLMIDRLRCKAVFEGFRGAEPVPRSVIRDLVVRVAALVAAHPDIAELDLNPVRCAGAAVSVVDVRIRVAAPDADSWLAPRELRTASVPTPAI